MDKLLGPPFGQCASDHMGSDLPVDRAGRSVLLADLFPLFSEKARGQIVTVQLLRSTEVIPGSASPSDTVGKYAKPQTRPSSHIVLFRIGYIANAFIAIVIRRLLVAARRWRDYPNSYGGMSLTRTYRLLCADRLLCGDIQGRDDIRRRG